MAVSEQPSAKPVKRWSVEFVPKPSYPRAGFWLDVNAVDETGAISAARQVLIHLWRRDPDMYAYRPIEVEHRSTKDSIDVPDSHERVYRALNELYDATTQLSKLLSVRPDEIQRLAAARAEAFCALGDS